MAKLALKKASTDVTVYLFAQDSSKTTGAGLTGLAYNTSNLTAYYVRPLGSATSITLATQTATGSHTDGGFVEVDATNMPGVYRLDLPDAVCATGVPSAVVMLKGATNLAPVLLEIQLTDFDLNTAGVTLADDAITASKFDESTAFPLKSADTGSTAVARVGADSDTLETLSDQMDAVKSDTANILADTGTDGVLLSVGTGSKQIDLSSGKVLLQPTQTGVTIPTVTNLTNLPTMPTDWISAAGVKADAVTKIQSGLATAAALATVSGYVDDLEARLTAARAGYLDKLNVSGALANTDNANSFKADVSNLALEATLTAIKGPGWSNETLVALMEAIDNISIDSGATPQQIWEYVSRTLTDASGLGLATAASQNLISNDLNAMPGKVWNHPTRTLTQSGSTIEYPAEGDPLVIYRDTTVAISLINLGNVTGADKMWFTVKDNVEDVDSKSIIQIDTNGLQYINGAPAGSAIVDGGIVINDPALGNISIFLKQEQAARLPLYEAYPTRWDVKVLKDGIVTILNIGSMYIKGTPTRAIL